MPENPLAQRILEKDRKKAEEAFGTDDGPSEPQTPEEWIGRRLKMAMAFRDIQAKDLARKAGVNRQTVWRYTTGRVTQQFGPMAEMARVLNVSLDYLAFGGEIRERTK